MDVFSFFISSYKEYAGTHPPEPTQLFDASCTPIHFCDHPVTAMLMIRMLSGIFITLHHYFCVGMGIKNFLWLIAHNAAPVFFKPWMSFISVQKFDRFQIANNAIPIV